MGCHVLGLDRLKRAQADVQREEGFVDAATFQGLEDRRGVKWRPAVGACHLRRLTCAYTVW